MRNTSIPSLDTGIFDLVTESATLWSYSRFNHRVVVKDLRKAKKLNRYLKTYPEDVVFAFGDEPRFPFTENQIPNVLAILGIKGR
jgi:hypothetical protein